VENFVEFIFADDQYLLIFAESTLRIWAKSAKKSSAQNFFRKQFLPLRYIKSSLVSYLYTRSISYFLLHFDKGKISITTYLMSILEKKLKTKQKQT